MRPLLRLINNRLCKQTTKILLIIITVVSLSSCNKTKNDLEEGGLNGKIKSIRELSYQAFGDMDTIVRGEVVMGENINNYYATYNLQGNQSSIINYDNLGNELDKWVFKYSSEGEALGGNYYIDNILSDSTYYTKDSKGNILEFYHLFADGKLRYKISYKYNRKNRITEEKVFDHENILNSVTKYTYKHGNCLEDANYDRYNRLQYFSKYVYDKKDRLIAQQLYNSDSSLNTSGTYTYNDNNDIIKQTTSVPNVGNLTYTYTYKYDKNENWIQKITFINSSAAYITVRQIEYYE